MVLIRLHDALFDRVERMTGDWLPGLFARFVFAGVLLVYFWHAASRKVVAAERGAEGGLLQHLTVSGNSFAQMAPKAFEAAGWDASKLGPDYWAMAYAGTYAEVLLPLLVVIGLATRLAAAGMIGFVAVQTWVDITGHGAGPETVGALFDRAPDAAILDQRLLWLVPLVLLVIRGAGAVSLDRLLATRLGRSAGPARPA